MKMLTSSYIALSEISVVSTPAPAISGKTIGTIVAPLLGVLFLKISTSRIISNAIRNIKKPPAVANEWISQLKMRSNQWPP